MPSAVARFGRECALPRAFGLWRLDQAFSASECAREDGDGDTDVVAEFLDPQPGLTVVLDRSDRQLENPLGTVWTRPHQHHASEGANTHRPRSVTGG